MSSLLFFLAGAFTAAAVLEVRDRIRIRRAREAMRKLIERYKEHLRG